MQRFDSHSYDFTTGLSRRAEELNGVNTILHEITSFKLSPKKPAEAV